MSDQIAPAPGPTGYQPAAGEGLAYIDVEVRPSRHYQTVGVSGRVIFPQPRSYTDALPALEDAYQALVEYANAKVDELAEVKQTAEAGAPAPAPATAAAPATQQQAPQQQAPQPSPDQLVQQELGGQPIPQQAAGQQAWLQGSKPNNRGTFRYLSTAAYSSDQLKQAAVQVAGQMGVPTDQIVVFDDRSGKYGLESGNTAYSAGKVKAGNNRQLKQAMGDRDIVGYVDFDDNGRVEVSLSKEGKSAVQALSMARQMQQPQQAPPQAPPPGDTDVPF